MSTTEKTITIHRELDDGTEVPLTATVFFACERRHRNADRVTDIDYDTDDLYDAAGNAHPMTDAEKETVGMEADDMRRALQSEFDDHAEAAAEDAWEASRECW